MLTTAISRKRTLEAAVSSGSFWGWKRTFIRVGFVAAFGPISDRLVLSALEAKADIKVGW